MNYKKIDDFVNGPLGFAICLSIMYIPASIIWVGGWITNFVSDFSGLNVWVIRVSVIITATIGVYYKNSIVQKKEEGEINEKKIEEDIKSQLGVSFIISIIMATAGTFAFSIIPTFIWCIIQDIFK